MFSVTERKLMHFPDLFSVQRSKYAECLYLWLTRIVPAFAIHFDNCVFQEDFLMLLFYICFFLEWMSLSLKVKNNQPKTKAKNKTHTKKEGICL